MKNNHSIAILMATYNGAKYLAAQIDSILAQTNHEWELFVHDDGSSDDTMAILKGYELEYPELIHVMPKTLKFGGGQEIILCGCWKMWNLNITCFVTKMIFGCRIR